MLSSFLIFVLALSGALALPRERLCPAGTYSANGLIPTGQSSCEPCALGSYQPEAGQRSCIEAEPGTYINVFAATRAMPCPAGTYQEQAGQSKCKACLSGTFNSMEGAQACCPCCAGTFSGPASARCDMCPSSRPFSKPRSRDDADCKALPHGADTFSPHGVGFAYHDCDVKMVFGSATCPATGGGQEVGLTLNPQVRFDIV
ncbi:hypothetical protein K523DRAFT_385196 [Schizophyllum commune Tattone D]|nr:hypothetical protein K523DRAFT_385196 [Schizophyllum commune Tattone D]